MHHDLLKGAAKSQETKADGKEKVSRSGAMHNGVFDGISSLEVVSSCVSGAVTVRALFGPNKGSSALLPGPPHTAPTLRQ